MTQVNNVQGASAAARARDGFGILNVGIKENVASLSITPRLTHRNMSSPIELTIKDTGKPQKQAGTVSVEISGKTYTVKVPNDRSMDGDAVARALVKAIEKGSKGAIKVDFDPKEQNTTSITLYAKGVTAPATPAGPTFREAEGVYAKAQKNGTLKALSGPPVSNPNDYKSWNATPPGLMDAYSTLFAIEDKVYLRRSGMGPGGIRSSRFEAGKLPK